MDRWKSRIGVSLRIFLIVNSLFFTLTSAVYAVEVDGIAAQVGSETLLKSEVVNELRRQGLSDSEYGAVRNQLIDRKLILRAAAEAKMTMQDWVVESRIREIIGQHFDGNRNKLMETLSRQKVSYPEWRARMKEDMVVSAMRWNVVDKNVTAGPAAMRREYALHPERYSSDQKVTVSVILLKPEDKSRREQISNELKTRPFAELAKIYSADSHASQGGVWKDIKPEEAFNADVCREIESMPKGTLSHWIEIDGWSYLLRKDAVSAGRQKSFQEAYVEIEDRVKEEASKKAYQAWLSRLREEAYIKIF